MNQRLSSFLVVGLLVSLALNSAIVLFLLAGRSTPQAFGQAVDSGKGFIMATEQTTDQTPVCFVLKTDDPPHLNVYKLDHQGLLYLSSCRDIGYDLKVPDRYFPKVGVQLVRTRPPVSLIREGVEEAERKAEQKEEKEKGKEKKKEGKKKKDLKEEEGEEKK